MINRFITFLVCLNICMSVSAKNEFVVYSEAFDVFEIVDGMSQWKEGTPFEYRKYYSDTFGLTSADKAKLNKYKSIRLKYYKEYPKSEDSIFSDGIISSDIISRTFASSSTLDEALLTLKKKKRIELEDIKELVSIYKYFKKNLSVIVKESSLLSSESVRINKVIKKSKLSNNIKKVDKFFNLPTSKIKGGRVKLVWWPQTDTPSIAFQGGRVILRVNPIKHSSMIDEEFITRAVVKSLIVSQGKTVKENLSKVFLESCPGIAKEEIEKSLWIEEPLIEAISKYYLPYLKLKKKFNPYAINNVDPWVDIFSKYLYGLTQYSIGKKGQFNREFVSNSAKYCQNLLNL